jgi:hypothetical protein
VESGGCPRLQTTHKSGNWNAQTSNDNSSEGWSFDLPTQVSAVHLAINGAVGEREGKMSALLLPVNCLLISIKKLGDECQIIANVPEEVETKI